MNESAHSVCVSGCGPAGCFHKALKYFGIEFDRHGGMLFAVIEDVSVQSSALYLGETKGAKRV